MDLEKPIIFIGLGRSGTTIISEIIFRHEDLGWPSNYQNKFPRNVNINRIRPFLDNHFWKLRGQKRQLNKVPFYNRYAFKPSEAYVFWEYITGPEVNFSRNFLLDQFADSERRQRIRRFFEKMVRYQKRKRLAFKITGPGRIGYLHSVFSDAIFVEITREPFANIRSLLKVSFWKERGMNQLWWQGAYSTEEEENAAKWRDKPALLAALQYKKVREKTYEEVQKYGVEYYSVSYEDFIREPQREINNLLVHIGLKKSDAIDMYLTTNKIYNRNTRSTEYFNKADKMQMIEILGKYYK